jgi:nucleoid DNA-binding protein
VTKKDIAWKIAEECGVRQQLALRAVQRVFDAIVETLATEGRIELRNFGVFETKRRRPREARNPRTGAKVSVPERAVVVFQPGREMAQRVAGLARRSAGGGGHAGQEADPAGPVVHPGGTG